MKNGTSPGNHADLKALRPTGCSRFIMVDVPMEVDVGFLEKVERR